MPAKDVYHDAVVHSLISDGWTITDDPLSLSYGGKDLYVDLGAERGTIAAEKNGEKIAVEVKSFLGRSIINDIEELTILKNRLANIKFIKVYSQRLNRIVCFTWLYHNEFMKNFLLKNLVS